MDKYDKMIAKETRFAHKHLVRQIENWTAIRDNFYCELYNNNYDKETREKMEDEKEPELVKMYDDLMIEHAKKCAEIYQKYQPIREFAAVAADICNKHTEK